MTNFFQKLKQGLQKSSGKLTTGISDIFTKQKVDSQTLDDLQDVLISADMGVKAATKIINSFSKRRLNKDCSAEDIKTELAELGSLRPEIPILRVLRIGEFQRDIRLAVAQILLRATAARKHCDAQHE